VGHPFSWLRQGQSNYAEQDDAADKAKEEWSSPRADAGNTVFKTDSAAAANVPESPWENAASVRAQLEKELQREGPIARRTASSMSPVGTGFPIAGVLGSGGDEPPSSGGDGVVAKHANLDKKRRQRKTRTRVGSEGEVVEESLLSELGQFPRSRGGSLDDPQGSSPSVPSHSAPTATSSATTAMRASSNVASTSTTWPMSPHAASLPPKGCIGSNSSTTLPQEPASPKETPQPALGCNTSECSGAPQASSVDSPRHAALPDVVSDEGEQENSAAATRLNPSPGQFDEAILAALAALPQGSLVDVLRRLSQRRPAEVSMAFGPRAAAPNGNTPQARTRKPKKAPPALMQLTQAPSPPASSPSAASPLAASPLSGAQTTPLSPVGNSSPGVGADRLSQGEAIGSDVAATASTITDGAGGLGRRPLHAEGDEASEDSPRASFATPAQPTGSQPEVPAASSVPATVSPMVAPASPPAQVAVVATPAAAAACPSPPVVASAWPPSNSTLQTTGACPTAAASVPVWPSTPGAAPARWPRGDWPPESGGGWPPIQ